MANSTGLVWKVALGVFVGGSALLLATCGVLGIAGHAAMKEQKRAIEQLTRQIGQSMSLDEVRQQREAASQTEAPKALPAGHRCINGQTFRRVENGWVQVSSTCARDASR